MKKTASHTKQVIAAVIGNALEWYDFIVFGFMIAIISRLFFPSESEYTSLMMTMATFGAGFFMRPVGAIVFGMYADRKGRKAALQLIIFLMTVAVAILTFAPTYAAIGIAAPLIILFARLLQGFSTGGEFSSSTAYLVEVAPAEKRGFYGSLQALGQGFAGILGALAGMLITGLFTFEQIDAWAWRLPFFAGLLIGPIGMYIRRYLEETTPFKTIVAPKTIKLGMGSLLKSHRRGLVSSFFLVSSGTMATYTLSIYMPIYAKNQLGLSLNDAFIALVISGVCSIAVGIPFAMLSDRIGRKPILLATMVVNFLAIYPLFAWVLSAPTFGKFLVLQIVFGLISGGWGPYPTAMAEQFPTGVRSTGLAITYNLAVALFGGTSPFFVSWLIKTTGSPMAPAYYLMFGTAVGFVATLFLVERHTERILH